MPDTLPARAHATVVTGGSSGIGAACCARLLAMGHTVVNVDINTPPDVSADRVPDRLHFVQADLADGQQARAAAADIAARFEIDGLLNNAGVARVAPLERVTDEQFDHAIALHLRAAIVMAQAVLPGMKARRYGRIVNMSSRTLLGKPDRTVYGGTKAALVGMTRTWAMELGAFGITVNAVAPGPILTPLFLKSNTPAQADALVASTVVKRGGTPEDVAQAVAFFFDEHSGFVTGQTLHVCGGASLGSVPW